MARRHPPPDPETLALARERLRRVLGVADAPRRAARAVAEQDDDVTPFTRTAGAAVGLDDLVPARRFTRWHLAVVAVVLAVGLVWGGWAWVRARPEALAAPTVSTASAPTSAPTVAASTPAAEAAVLVVHVLGAVRHPGLVRLPLGARVEDAIDAAGGLRRDADPAELNLAQALDDGVQVVVGTAKRPAGEVRSGGGGGSAGSATTGSGAGSGRTDAVVDLNRASATQLETLPGVGPVTAQKIADWRQQHGRFSRVEELQEVDGIGPKTYARIAPHARV